MPRVQVRFCVQLFLWVFLTHSKMGHLHAQSTGEISCDQLFLWVFLTHSKMDHLHAQSTGEILCVLLLFDMDFSH